MDKSIKGASTATGKLGQPARQAESRPAPDIRQIRRELGWDMLKAPRDFAERR